MDLTFEWPPWKKLVNERFLPLVNMDTRHVILWGSRGSSKSDFTTKKLILFSVPYSRILQQVLRLNCDLKILGLIGVDVIQYLLKVLFLG